ncbi:MAG: dihydroorotate dehydrogenase electron transfer subunit [Candidatus Electrothrix sp. YB6]
MAAAALPGQFVMVRVTDSLDPLLRRPLSIHRVSADGNISLLFKVLGKGTEMLARRGVGDQLDLVGPLGKGFTLPDDRPFCLIGGGMGIAPLLFLAEQLHKLHSSGQRTAYRTAEDYVLLGARNKDELAPLVEAFSDLRYTVRTATDDGSMGHHGFIPDLLDAVLPAVHQVYTCGPHPMMRTIAEQCRQAEMPCQVSLETHMACGMGACLGCTVQGKDGLVHVCKQGPVFFADQLQWSR